MKKSSVKDGSKNSFRPASEEQLLQLLQRELPPLATEVASGIGDDCAVVRSSGSGTMELLKTDAVVEGVHFSSGTSLVAVGWKALCRPISDIAAMGGTPKYALITVAAPSHWVNAKWRALYRGIGKAASSYQISVVGGETTLSPAPHSHLFISVALSGSVQKRHLRLRSEGLPGDLLCVTGKLGGSLKSGRHLRFQPRLREGQWLASQRGVTAMMDLSDGLGSDLPKLASSSNCAFQITPASLPLHRGCEVDEAVSDGEDYELLCCIRPSAWRLIHQKWRKHFSSLPLTCIGVLVPADNPSTPLASGYDHLRP